jgi:hypothetical protein
MTDWPEIFTNPELIKTRDERALCADGLCAWALVLMGTPHPKSFGDVLVALADRIGMKKAATGDNLSSFAVEKGWLKPERPSASDIKE